MTDLIKRLQEAEEGCPLLDREIWVALEFDGRSSPIDAPEYTTSLDAALALAERLGFSVSQILNEALEGPSGEGIWATGWNPDKPHAPQIAKFVCIAILKATDTGREA